MVVQLKHADCKGHTDSHSPQQHSLPKLEKSQFWQRIIFIACQNVVAVYTHRLAEHLTTSTHSALHLYDTQCWGQVFFGG